MGSMETTPAEGEQQEPEGTGGSEQGTLSRKVALEVILESDGGRRQFIDESLEERLRRDDLSDRDRHLLQETAYGAVRHRNTLDHLLDAYVRFPMKRQEPPVRWALRLAAYQMVYLNRIPAHAAIDRTLEALKGFPGVGRRSIGFANAVLRKLAGDIHRKSEEPPLDSHDPAVIPIRRGFCHFAKPVLPLHTLDGTGHFALKYSHPRWLVERWIGRFGESEAVALFLADNQIPRVTVRVTQRAPDREQLLSSLVSQGVQVDAPGSGSSLRLSRTGDPRKLEALIQGWIQVQDFTATAIGEALEPPPDANVLDLCASPGGKALQILERLGPGGRLVACDVDEEKLGRLRENLERSGKPFSLRLVPPQPEALDLGEKFTHVLLDAPCSNTGVLARRPEARWRIRPEDFSKLADFQRRLLASAARHLAAGGRLVYATCSIEPEEDEEIIAWATENLSALRKTSEKSFYPRGAGDGGYFAVLERAG